MASKGIKPKKAGAVEIDVSSCATIDDMHRCRDAILILCELKRTESRKY